MRVIDFLFDLVAGHANFVGVDDHHVIAGIEVRREGGLSLPISRRATFVAKRPKTWSVASTTNHSAPTLSASASSPLATYVLIATVTPFPVETNCKFRGCGRFVNEV